MRNPNKKMSKSDPDPKNRICLTDTPDDISKKIKKAVTDFTSQVTFAVVDIVSCIVNVCFADNVRPRAATWRI